jgi:adenosylcobinamide kinase/adenosylcobinamide-phosphate guanylyltransferase|uniref:Adenosylcobinamide kinase n=1 Tax=Desulfobacca acetoxidans TaxID=60893 RepID=A0A7C5EM85_9BACT
MSQASFHLALVLGGTRSGKSRYALDLAQKFPPPRLYLATAEAQDGEMAERIARHRRERGEGWDTLEAPLSVADALKRAQGRYQVILVDCLTLWLSNWLLQNPGKEKMQELCRGLEAQVRSLGTPAIFVSNEVGWGIVPENPLAREFRDWSGWLHQLLAAAADLVVLLVAGIPLTLKSPRKKDELYGT